MFILYLGPNTLLSINLSFAHDCKPTELISRCEGLSWYFTVRLVDRKLKFILQ